MKPRKVCNARCPPLPSYVKLGHLLTVVLLPANDKRTSIHLNSEVAKVHFNGEGDASFSTRVVVVGPCCCDARVGIHLYEFWGADKSAVAMHRRLGLQMEPNRGSQSDQPGCGHGLIGINL